MWATGIIVGYEVGGNLSEFRPSESVLRAQFAKMLSLISEGLLGRGIGHVTLTGWVTMPYKRDDIDRRIRQIDAWVHNGNEFAPSPGMI